METPKNSSLSLKDLCRIVMPLQPSSALGFFYTHIAIPFPLYYYYSYLLHHTKIPHTRCVRFEVWYNICMRKESPTTGEHYHIYNRGNNRQDIFRKEADREKLLLLFLLFQSEINSELVKQSLLHNGEELIALSSDSVFEKRRYVELINFILMPNHFHLTVYQTKKGGISKYLQRVQNAYTKYFNEKYDLSGHLFQGPYHLVRIASNEQLLHLSSYIHCNCRDLDKNWVGKEEKYYWSSFSDYVEKNRWGPMLKQKIVLEQFKSPHEYKQFVKTSGIKEVDAEHLLFEENL